MTHIDTPGSVLHFAVQHSTAMMYGGSATAVVGGTKTLFNLNIVDYSAIAAAVIGSVVALIGLYFSWRKHKELVARVAREQKEHEVRMEALRAALHNEYGHTERRHGRLAVEELLNDNVN